MTRINIETEMAIPLDDMRTALAAEVDAARRSIRYCRGILGISARQPTPKNNGNGEMNPVLLAGGQSFKTPGIIHQVDSVLIDSLLIF